MQGLHPQQQTTATSTIVEALDIVKRFNILVNGSGTASGIRKDAASNASLVGGISRGSGHNIVVYGGVVRRVRGQSSNESFLLAFKCRVGIAQPGNECVLFKGLPCQQGMENG